MGVSLQHTLIATHIDLLRNNHDEWKGRIYVLVITLKSGLKTLHCQKNHFML